LNIQEIKTQILENKAPILFMSKMIGLFLIIHAIYEYLISPYTNLDKWLIGLIMSQAEWFIEFLGYQLLEPNSIYENHFGVLGSSGVVIGNPCDGLSLFILFSSFLIVFKGNKWFKSLFILSGIAIIHFLNVARVLTLALIVVYSPESLDFHHKYTFTLFVYLCIFLMWYFRIYIYKKKAW
jgi:exosortase/archaeosortase family protein